MLTSVNAINKKVVAQDADKSEKPFYCPECNSETILRQGLVKTHHFAHKPPISCQYGQGESDGHRNCKESIYDHLRQNQDLVKNCELEKNLGRVRPDIYFEKNGQRIAIEVQISNLTMEKIIYRTEQYRRLGVSVLWLPILTGTMWHVYLNSDDYSPKQWEKWLHATYFGRVYYWSRKLDILPFHYDKVTLYKEWSDYGGGYEYASKRYKRLEKGNLVSLLDDFEPVERSAWRGGKIFVPSCKILRDKQEKWWK